MSILNSLPTKIGIATETSNGLMSYEDKILVNKINRIEADVSGKLNKDEKIKSSQLDTSNNAVKIQLDNLSKEVMNAINGATPLPVPEIKDGSLYTELYANNSVTSDKRTAVGSVAVIVSEDFCNFDTSGTDEVVLSIPKDYTVYFGSKIRTIENTPESIVLPKGEPAIITYSIIHGFDITETARALNEDDFIIGAFDGTNVTMFNGRYTVDGSTIAGEEIINGNTIQNFTLDPKKLAIQHGSIISDKTLGPYINIDFNSKFIEIIKPFDLNIADQVMKTIKVSASSKVEFPENTFDREFLYIYYDIGSDKLKLLWSSNDIEESIIGYGEKLVLIGIVNTENAVGINRDFISVNSVSLKNIEVKYADIFTGKITIDLNNKVIRAISPKTFIDGKLISLTEDTTQNIILTDDVIDNIVSSGISYTLGAIRVNFDSDKYKLVFIETEQIKSLGLDTIYLTTIKNYSMTNIENISMIKPDGNVIKFNDVIHSGYTLPIDNETIVVKLTTEIIEGNLTLTSTTVPGTSVVDPITNTVYKITKELKYQTIVEDLHGLYNVVFNTETGKIEIISMLDNNIDKRIYISLGSVYELNDSMSYTSYGPIVDHVILNSNRPANYAIIDGPDPDKGYDWSNNRLVLPKDIYLLANSQYSLYCQNMSMNKYVDNDYILYEIGLPHTSIITENVLNINSPISGDFETRIVGKFKGNNNCLFKDVNIHFERPEGKELSILCIGDETVDMNMPSYIKEFMAQLGYTATMLGKTKNVYELNRYGMKNLIAEYGEGHRGWRMSDFMCKTRRKDGTNYYINNNPFMNNNKFDFPNYMTANGYDNVDVVVISVGLNDITGHHIASATEDIENLTIYQNIEQLPNMYKEMIASIQAFNNDIKIIINPTMIKGMDDDYNRKSLLLTETLIYDLKDIQNVFIVPGYMTQPIFVSANKSSTENYDQYNNINDTKIGSSVNSSEINGVGQSNLAYLITSAIVGVTK